MSTALEMFGRFEYLLYNGMNASILVPMAVVWARRRYFPAPVRLLSWYVYLSLFSVIGARFFHYGNPPSNHWYLIGFNCGKIALFAAVYYQVLTAPKVRRLVATLAAGTLAGLLVACCFNTQMGVSLSRVAHCFLLAGFALLYFNQFFDRKSEVSFNRDPLWLLSMGQLIYSAVTVSFFSYEYFMHGQSVWGYIFMDIGGLVFNIYLTLAFLRAKQVETQASEPEYSRASLLFKH